MPASISIAGTGCIANVNGSSIEMEVSAPVPGSTPIKLPSTTPTKHHMRLCGSNASPKP